MAGLPYLMRIAGFGLRAPKNPVRGYDVAGRVEAVAENVTRFQPGDEVFGTRRGSFAEYACARADRLAPKPANLIFEQAAAVPISGYAALQAVRDQRKVRPGQRVLIIGAEGGVGTFAVQLAKAVGKMTGVCSTRKWNWCDPPKDRFCAPGRLELRYQLRSLDAIDAARLVRGWRPARC
jgi:NADPH:quinone reductase-like Zn-dependent oxidoreductase